MDGKVDSLTKYVAGIRAALRSFRLNERGFVLSAVVYATTSRYINSQRAPAQFTGQPRFAGLGPIADAGPMQYLQRPPRWRMTVPRLLRRASAKSMPRCEESPWSGGGRIRHILSTASSNASSNACASFIARPSQARSKIASSASATRAVAWLTDSDQPAIVCAYSFSFSFACAAASRAIGTRGAEHET